VIVSCAVAVVVVEFTFTDTGLMDKLGPLGFDEAERVIVPPKFARLVTVTAVLFWTVVPPGTPWNCVLVAATEKSAPLTVTEIVIECTIGPHVPGQVPVSLT